MMFDDYLVHLHWVLGTLTIVIPSPNELLSSSSGCKSVRLTDTKVHQRGFCAETVFVDLHILGSPWCRVHITHICNHMQICNPVEQEYLLQ